MAIRLWHRRPRTLPSVTGPFVAAVPFAAALFFAATLPLAVPAWGGGTSGAARSPADSLAGAVYRLQRSCRFADALGVGRQLIEARQADQSPPWKLEDAYRFVSTAEICLQLSETDVHRLATMYIYADSIQVLLRAGRFDEAKPLAEDRQVLSGQLFPPDHRENLNAFADLAASLLESGQYKAALETYEVAAAGFYRTFGNSHPQTARALNNVAVGCGYLGRFEESVSLLKTALAIREEALGSRHALVGKTLHSLGSVLEDLGRFEEAERVLRKALAIRSEALPHDHRDVANTRESLAHLLRARGNLTGAEPLYREAAAVKVAVLGNDHPQTARSWNSLARLRRDQGFYGEARALHERALEILERSLGDKHPDVASTYYAMGTLERRCENLDLAEAHFRRSLALRRKILGPEHALVALTQNGLGRTLLELDQPGLARPLLEASLDTRRSLLGRDHPNLAPILANLACLEEALGHDERALQLAEEAVGLERTRVDSERSYVVHSFVTLGRIQRRLGRLEESASTLTEAVSIYEVARSRVGFGLGRATFTTAPYPLLAATYLALGDSLAAWEVTERSHGRLLADFDRLSKQRMIDPMNAQREKQIVHRLFEKERAWTRLKGVSNEALKEQAESEVLHAEAEWARFKDELSRRYPRRSGSGYDLERIQNTLSANEAVIGWLDAEGNFGSGVGTESSWAWVLRDTGPVRWCRLASTTDSIVHLREILEHTSTWPFRVLDTRPFDAAALELWRDRMEPLKPLLKEVDQLWVVTGGTMAGIPIDALVTAEGQSLAELYRISYIPSATSLAWLRENPPRRTQGRTLLIGDPTADPGRDTETAHAPFAPLPGTRAEVERLAEILPCPTVWVGAAASEDSLTLASADSSLQRYDRIHIATHAFFNPDQPELSSLILSVPGDAASGFDGRVTVKEILGGWQLNADLVTLSSCQSGLGPRVAGEGFVGLVQAILQAGARSVVVSLWPVGDRSSSLFMEYFYTFLLEGDSSRTKSEALRLARLQLRDYVDPDGSRPFQHPSYWAPFILIGDPG